MDSYTRTAVLGYDRLRRHIYSRIYRTLMSVGVMQYITTVPIMGAKKLEMQVVKSGYTNVYRQIYRNYSWCIA